MADFREILDGLGIRYHQGAGAEITICCPFCPDNGEGEDTRFRLGINIDDNKGNCFNCGFKSRHAMGLVLRKLKAPDVRIDRPTRKEDEDREVRLPSDFERLRLKDVANDELLQAARRYVRNRGITEEQIRKYSIGVSLTGRYAYRIVFPIFYKRKLEMFVTRDMTGNAERKYLNSHGPKTVFGLPKRNHGSAILSEGIFKALALENAFRYPSLCVLGSKITDRQIKMLRGFKRIYLFPDPDEVGIEGFMEIGNALKRKFSVYIAWPPPEKQADEMSAEELSKFKWLRFDRHIKMKYLHHASRVEV